MCTACNQVRMVLRHELYRTVRDAVLAYESGVPKARTWFKFNDKTVCTLPCATARRLLVTSQGATVYEAFYYRVKSAHKSRIVEFIREHHLDGAALAAKNRKAFADELKAHLQVTDPKTRMSLCVLYTAVIAKHDLSVHKAQSADSADENDDCDADAKGNDSNDDDKANSKFVTEIDAKSNGN